MHPRKTSLRLHIPDANRRARTARWHVAAQCHSDAGLRRSATIWPSCSPTRGRAVLQRRAPARSCGRPLRRTLPAPTARWCCCSQQAREHGSSLSRARRHAWTAALRRRSGRDQHRPGQRDGRAADDRRSARAHRSRARSTASSTSGTPRARSRPWRACWPMRSRIRCRASAAPPNCWRAACRRRTANWPA